MKGYKQTALQCPECKNISYIFRKKGNLKKPGHLKKLYCPYCKKEVNQVEVRDPSEFYIDDDTELKPVNKKGDKVICHRV